MYYRTFTPEEVQQAKEIRAKEDGVLGDNNFDSDTRYLGKLGEWAFAEMHPEFTQNSKDFEKLKFDFFTPSNESLEVKTNIGGDYEWGSFFNVSIDCKQYNNGNYEILVYCFYNQVKRKLTIIGWNYLEEFNKHPSKKFIKFGEMCYTAKGTPRFKVREKGGMYDWEASVLRPIEKLIEIYKGGVNL